MNYLFKIKIEKFWHGNYLNRYLYFNYMLYVWGPQTEVVYIKIKMYIVENLIYWSITTTDQARSLTSNVSTRKIQYIIVSLLRQFSGFLLYYYVFYLFYQLLTYVYLIVYDIHFSMVFEILAVLINSRRIPSSMF